MPRLMIAAGIFHPEAGGPATYLKEILPALQAKGWQASVLTYGTATQGNYPYSVKRIPRRAPPFRLAHYHLASYPMVAASDLIYAHTIDLPVAWGNKPRVIKIVGDQAWERCIRKGWVAPSKDIDAFQQDKDAWFAERQKQSRSRQVQDFDGVIVPSAYLKRMVMGWGVAADRIYVIYNAIPPAQDGVADTQQEARQLLGWDDRPTLVTAARLTPWKGIDHLMQALKQVKDVRLVVAGDGEEMPRLQAMAKSFGDRVQLLGKVPRERLSMMMKAADYFALYSGYEGLPHTILEALRVGAPIIASDKGGNPEVVREGVNGLLVPYVDVDALAETLQRAFSGRMRETLAQNTHVGMERFEFEMMVSQTDRILRQYLR